MKLSEIKGDAALDLLADLIDPVVEIMADKEVSSAFQSGNTIGAIRSAIKGHKKAVVTMLALLDGAPVENYEVTLVTLPVKLLELLNDPLLASVFPSQGQKGDANSSGSASATIGA